MAALDPSLFIRRGASISDSSAAPRPHAPVAQRDELHRHPRPRTPSPAPAAMLLPDQPQRVELHRASSSSPCPPRSVLLTPARWRPGPRRASARRTPPPAGTLHPGPGAQPRSSHRHTWAAKSRALSPGPTASSALNATATAIALGQRVDLQRQQNLTPSRSRCLHVFEPHPLWS